MSWGNLTLERGGRRGEAERRAPRLREGRRDPPERRVLAAAGGGRETRLLLVHVCVGHGDGRGGAGLARDLRDDHARGLRGRLGGGLAADGGHVARGGRRVETGVGRLEARLDDLERTGEDGAGRSSEPGNAS